MEVHRTPAYWTLTATLVLVYIASVVVLQALFRISTGQASQIAVVASTLVAAALLDPSRRWIQLRIDRRFNRRNLERRSPT